MPNLTPAVFSNTIVAVVSGYAAAAGDYAVTIAALEAKVAEQQKMIDGLRQHAARAVEFEREFAVALKDLETAASESGSPELAKRIFAVARKYGFLTPTGPAAQAGES